MKFRIEKVDDTDAARDMHKLAFGGCEWPGDDHEFWIAKDEHGAVVGFASLNEIDPEVAFLSRAAVTLSAKGKGLHRKLIQTRIKWAQKQGATLFVAYVEVHNHDSMINLLRCGFRFAPNSWVPGMRNYHMMYFSPRPVAEARIKKALADMGD